jgi:asparagine synthase (glutamine-hydrolysing)
MFIFAIAAGFRDDAPSAERAAALANGFPIAPADGIATAAAPNARAMVGRWNVVRRDRTAAPTWDAAAGLLFAGDVRLYNRPELIAELGHVMGTGDSEPPDLELARLAYLRWNEGAPAHLVGDFAFAAWNERTRTLFAARDQVGVRPLYYCMLGDGVAIASDVRQLLALFERPFDQIDDRQIGDWLTLDIRDQSRTFFRDIKRVAPGHRLSCDARGSNETRYWTPPRAPVQAVPYDEACASLRATFGRAVRDRLESDHPIIAHSSGGFDSSTIVMAADAIYRAEPTRPRLTTASALARGMESDDSRYMDAVAAEAAFESVRWNVVEETPQGFPGVSRSTPALQVGLGGGPRRDLELAEQRNARVLITGTMGDDVWHATGVLRDFVRHGRWIAAARNLAAMARRGAALRRIVDAGLGIFPPAAADRVARRLFERGAPPPAWLGPAVRDRSKSAVPVRLGAAEPMASPFHLQTSVWAKLTHPAGGMAVDAMVEYGTDVGVEVRMPYTDVRLIEQVLSMPWWQRDPKGHYRRTGRDALGPLLPRVFVDRVGQRPATDVWHATALRRAASTAALIETTPWLSAPYVDQGIARAMLRDVLTEARRGTPENAILVGEFAALEAWLRGHFG